jgi:hypothetical protein
MRNCRFWNQNFMFATGLGVLFSVEMVYLFIYWEGLSRPYPALVALSFNLIRTFGSLLQRTNFGDIDSDHLHRLPHLVS